VTDRALFFVVSRLHGRPTPALYWDELPRAGVRNLDYIVRLDQLPNGPQLVAQSLAQLFAVYQHLKRRGKLPPRWEPPPRPKARPATRKPGHREYHARRFMPDPPYEEPIVSPRGEAAGVGGPVQHFSASRSEVPP
jgi:hypothetical protein